MCCSLSLKILKETDKFHPLCLLQLQLRPESDINILLNLLILSVPCVSVGLLSTFLFGSKLFIMPVSITTQVIDINDKFSVYIISI